MRRVHLVFSPYNFLSPLRDPSTGLAKRIAIFERALSGFGLALLLVLGFGLPSAEAASNGAPALKDYAVCAQTAGRGNTVIREGRPLRIRPSCRTGREIEQTESAALCLRKDRTGNPRLGRRLQVRGACSTRREVSIGTAQLRGSSIVLPAQASLDPDLKLCSREDRRAVGSPRAGSAVRVRTQCRAREIELSLTPQVCSRVRFSRNGPARVSGRTQVQSSCKPKRSIAVGRAVLEGAATPPKTRSFSFLESSSSSVTWIEERRFELSLETPWPAAAHLRDRPLENANEEALEIWVEEWDQRNADADPPVAAISLEAIGGSAPAWAIGELSEPTLSADGSLSFQLNLLESFGIAQSLLLNPRFGPTRVFIDEPEFEEPTSLFLISASFGQLLQKRFDRYTLSLSDPGMVTDFTQGPLREVNQQTVSEWLEGWVERGFDENPPRAGLVFLDASNPTELEWGLAELTSPRLDANGLLLFTVEFLWKPSGRLALFTEDGGTSRKIELLSPTLFVDAVPQLPSTDGPTVACETDASCRAGEICDATGYCIAEKICSSTAPCEKAQRCDPSAGICTWKACLVSDDCGASSETCNEGVCVANATPAVPGDQEPENRPGLWGSSRSSDLLKSTCHPFEPRCDESLPCPGEKICSRGICLDSCSYSFQCTPAQTCAEGFCVSEIEALCRSSEQNFSLRVRYLAETLANNRDFRFGYQGQFTYQGVNESLRTPTNKEPLVYPSPAIRDKLNAPFSILSDPWQNAIVRIGPVLFGRESVAPYPDGTRPTGPNAAYEFIQRKFKSLIASTAPDGDFPDGYIQPDSEPDRLRLNREFGGGGGFGCLIGTVDPQTGVLSPPVLQFGGGFGFGLAESDGLDIGYGGGINTCAEDSTQSCIEAIYRGAGGGINAATVNEDKTTGNYDQSGTDGDLEEFANSLPGSTASALRDADQVYIICGLGGGLGFQHLAHKPGSEEPGFFSQSYGFGGGGSSFALLKKRPLTDEGNFLTQISRTEFSETVTNYNELISSPSDSELDFSDASMKCQPEQSQRGLLKADGSARALPRDPSVIGVSFSPYSFELGSDCRTTTTEDSYIPGSTSSSDLFFGQWDAAQAQADVKTGGIKRVAYTLNLNPARLSEYATSSNDPAACHQGQPLCAASAINDSVLGALSDAGVLVSLAIPIFIQHDNDNHTTGAAAIVNDNLEMLDYTIAALQKFENIDAIIIGTAEHGAKKGFDVLCNGYTYKQEQNRKRCKGYQSDLTFEDYYYLLEAIFERMEKAAVVRPLRVAVRQSAANWFKETRIRPRDAGGFDVDCRYTGTCPNGRCKDSCGPADDKDNPMSLHEYWQMEQGRGARDGLKYFISDLPIPSNVTLRPMFKLDLVEDALNGKVAGKWATVSCTPALDNIDCAESTLTDLLDLLPTKLMPPLAAFKPPIVETGWYGVGVGAFLQSDAFTRLLKHYPAYYDELIDQPWRSIPKKRVGMPKAVCGHVYPVAHLDESNPAGPPMSSQLPASCSPNFYDPNLNPGDPAKSDCLCLTNSTNYPAQFSPFISNVTPPSESFSPPLSYAPLLTIPPNRVSTFPRKAPRAEQPTSYDFNQNAVEDKIGSFSLAITFPRYPFTQLKDEYGASTGHQLGEKVAAPTPNELVPSQVCVGVSDAQTGAASANNARPCLELWYQFDLDAQDKPRTRIERDDHNCVATRWTAKGTAWNRVSGWELKTLEAPEPKPDKLPRTYNSAPIAMVPQETQETSEADSEVSTSFTYCSRMNFPTGLSPGDYFIRVQPVGGTDLSSVDATDIEFLNPDPDDRSPINGPSIKVLQKPKHKTTWTTLGKFTINYPDEATQPPFKPLDYLVTSIAFEYANQDPLTRVERPKSTFTVTPPIDNGLSDFTLPGANPNATTPPPAGDEAFVTKMTMTFNRSIAELVTPTNDGTQCIVEFEITAGKNQGDQGGKAKLTNAPINLHRPQDACWLELGSAFTFVNGGAFQWVGLPQPDP